MTLTFPDLVLPIVHTNGTSRKELVAQRHAVVLAIAHAVKALEDAYPNPRDYYPEQALDADGRNRYDRALLQHQRRMSTLTHLNAEIAREEGLLRDRD